MRNLSELRHYQQHAVEHLVTHPEAGLFLDMGLGKTVTTLTAIWQLMYDTFEVSKVLIVAPKRVAQTVWHTEAQNWSHLTGLKFSLVLGSERKRVEALQAKAEIYVINREMLAWLISHLQGGWPFDMLILDESSSFKHHTSARFKALRLIRPRIKRVVALTGTPMSNGLIDLWAQMYLLDQGQRLGKTITSYRDKYFKPGKRNGAIIYSYDLRKDIPAEEEVGNKIKDICISMKARDYLELPPRTDRIDRIDMTPDIAAKYKSFEKEKVLEYADNLEGGEITAMNAASLTGKLLQFANGAIYTGAIETKDRDFYEVHNLKIEALGTALEAANGNPMLVFYQFKSDIERIQRHLREFKPYLLGKDTLRDVDRWNRKEIPVMLLHAASAGHGLNMQAGGHNMYWFGRPWPLELYQQGVGRLDRSGQAFPVLNLSGVMVGTGDEKVIAAHESNDFTQESVLGWVRALVKMYKG